MIEVLGARPALSAVAGALVIAFSAILVRLAGVAPSTAAIFRCAYALPVLWLLVRDEDRRLGPRPPTRRRPLIWAGVFFAADLILWHHAIQDVGAGLATVLGNLQVVVVPIAAWLVLGERPSARVAAAVPLALSGVVLISGALERGAYGAQPVRGVVFGIFTGLTYAGFILTLRQANQDNRRPAAPLLWTTSVATVAALAAGAVLGEADPVPSWPAHGWLVLLALSSQVLGWMLISVSLARLPAALTSLILTLQPIGSVALGALLLDERPSGLQLGGVLLVCTGLVVLAAQRRPSRAEAPAVLPGERAPVLSAAPGAD